MSVCLLALVGCDGLFGDLPAFDLAAESTDVGVQPDADSEGNIDSDGGDLNQQPSDDDDTGDDPSAEDTGDDPANNGGECSGDGDCPEGYDCIDEECVADESDCSDEYTLCGSKCVDVDADDDHCGGCDNSCEHHQFCVNGSCGPANFVVEEIDSDARWFKEGFDLVIDAADRPHISYARSDETHADWYYDLIYVQQNTGGGWEEDIVFEDYHMAGNITLLLDSQGNSHLMFKDDYELSYAYNGSGSWEIDREISLQTAMPVSAWHNSMVIDSDDNPHLVGSFHYASKIDGTWYGYPIDTGDVESPDIPAAAIDGDDNFHLLYTDGDDNSSLHYLRGKGSEWETEAVGSGYKLYTNHGIAVDDSGRLHIAFVDDEGGSGGDDRLMYGTRDVGESNWLIEEVDQGDNLVRRLSIAIDSKSRPHISYHDYDFDGKRQLKYARKSKGQWFVTTVDHDADIQIHGETAIDVDSRDIPHITYCNCAPSNVSARYSTIQ